MSVQLFNADCLEKMKDIPDGSVDMVLCDLPYGTTACKWDVELPLKDFIVIGNKYLTKDEYLLNNINKQNYSELISNWNNNYKLGLWAIYNRILKSNGCVALFGQEPFSSKLRESNIINYKYDWYWEKERLTNIAQVKKRAGKTIETISIFYKSQPTYNPQMIKYEGPLRKNKVKNGRIGILSDNSNRKVIEYKDTGWRYPTQLLKFNRDCLTTHLHLTQKPVALCEYLIKTYTNENSTVLDNCMGSGSTGVACVNTNRNFIGIELDEDYFKIAKTRIEERISELSDGDYSIK